LSRAKMAAMELAAPIFPDSLKPYVGSMIVRV